VSPCPVCTNGDFSPTQTFLFPSGMCQRKCRSSLELLAGWLLPPDCAWRALPTEEPGHTECWGLGGLWPNGASLSTPTPLFLFCIRVPCSPWCMTCVGRLPEGQWLEHTQWSEQAVKNFVLGLLSYYFLCLLFLSCLGIRPDHFMARRVVTPWMLLKNSVSSLAHLRWAWEQGSLIPQDNS
jgi:hypothetical protein